MRYARLAIGGLLGMVLTAAAHANFAWTFDCDVENWIVTPSHEMSFTNAGGEGKVLLTFQVPDSEPYDPVFQSPSGNDFDLSETPFVIIEFEATNVPSGDEAALFLFGGGAIWRVGWTENGISWGPGFNRVVINMSTASVFEVTETGLDVNDTPIEIVRWDIPDNTPFAGYEDGLLAIDFVALSDDENFVPVQDTTPCADSPFPQAAPGTPAAGGVGLALLASAVAGAAIWRGRRRARQG